MDRALRRHKRVFGFCRWLLGGTLKRIYGFHTAVAEVGKGPFLITANHNGELDPALLALSFKEHMYFVSSEHVFRKGFISKVLTYFFAPIARVKGMTDATAALNIIRHLKKGTNVCLFAEGNRSYNGITGPIFPATGKLAKAAGASLITYHFEGGYLTTPRWSRTTRKGYMRGKVVNVYTPEQLKQMTPEEVNDHIRADIWEDAFERQKTNPHAYKGKDLAKGLENALYFCPKCGRTGTLHSEGGVFSCGCGLRVQYTELGFFEKVEVIDPEPMFTTVRDWDFWQDKRVLEYADALQDDEIAYSDEDVMLIAIENGHKDSVAEIGKLTISKQALCVGSHRFPLGSISSMGLVGIYKMLFSVEGNSYELRAAKTPYCGRKYLTFYDLLKSSGRIN
jgi:1-acyl-sn-glycerol-3-phosphate acyltransferase